MTENYTGLQWEKKNGAGGGANFANPHDVDNTYTWSTSGTPADGAAYTDFLSQLNTCVNDATFPPTGVIGGFAGHCDWRLPTIVELQTILLAPFLCGTSPCIDPVFGPTAASPWPYWSSTTADGAPGGAWYFGDGAVYVSSKADGFFVRAGRRVMVHCVS